MRDDVRLSLDLAYGPDPHNEKVANAIVDKVRTALLNDEVVVMASDGIPYEWTIYGIHARCATRDVLRLAFEEAEHNHE